MTPTPLDWHLGLARAALLWGPALYTGWRLTGALSGLPRALAAAVVGLTQLTLVTLAAGLAGCLTLKVLIGVQLALLVLVVWLSYGQTGTTARPTVVPAALAMTLPALAIGLARSLLAPPTNWDSLAYHLPFAVDWLQTGAIAGHLSLPAYPAQVMYFPLGGDLVWVWALLPWVSDFGVGPLNHAFLALTCAGIAALAAHLGARPAASATGAALFALLPLVPASLLGTANVDLLLTFSFLAAILFLLHDGGAHAWVSALAAGLLLGTKLSALILIPIAGLLGWLGGWRPSAGRLAGGLAAALVLGCFWYVRNFLATGNPVYPLGSGPMEVAARFVDREVTAGSLRELVEAVWNMLGVATPAFAFGWVAHLACRRGALDRALAVAGLALAASYLVTPGTVTWVAYNLRYALPGLALLAVSLSVALEESELSPESMTALGASLSGVQLLLCAPHLTLPARWVLTALGGAGIAALAWRARGLRLVLCVALLDLVAFQLYQEHHQPRTRFAWFLSGYHGGLMVGPAAFADGLNGSTIAVAGPLPPYYLAGSRFQNRVVAIPVEAGGERLPHQAPGGTLRARPDRAAWQQALARVRPDHLVVSRLSADAVYPPEDAWAQLEPARFRLLASHVTSRIYQVIW